MKVFKLQIIIRSFQSYECMNGHRFDGNTGGMYADSFIEWVVFVYLRALSLNRTIEIARVTHEQDILSKGTLLSLLERVADELPTHEDITNLFHPQRSGHLAFDAVFFKWKRIGFGILVAFDPKTFDIICYQAAPDEGQPSWDSFISQTAGHCRKYRIEPVAVYSDGAKYLAPSVKKYFSKVPYQLCVVHKLVRMGQKVPVKSVYHSRKMSRTERESILAFKSGFEAVLFAETKQESLKKMDQLKAWVKDHPDSRFKTALNGLKRNFRLTLTHFSHPGMLRDNNMIETFNAIVSIKFDLFKGFKKLENIDRWLKLVLLDYRFRPMREARDSQPRNSSPLQRALANIPPHYNWIKLLRKTLLLSFVEKKKSRD